MIAIFYLWLKMVLTFHYYRYATLAYFGIHNLLVCIHNIRHWINGHYLKIWNWNWNFNIFWTDISSFKEYFVTWFWFQLKLCMVEQFCTHWLVSLKGWSENCCNSVFMALTFHPDKWILMQGKLIFGNF